MDEMFELEKHEVLSPNGRVRREEILGEAMRTAVKRRQKRIAVRGMVALLVTGGISLGILLNRKSPTAPPTIARQESPTPKDIVSPQKQATEIVITRIQTDESLVDKLRVRAQKPTWQKLSDDELLKQLAAAGKPAGLAYVGGKSELLFR